MRALRQDRSVFSNNSSDYLLRKTSLFGVYQRKPEPDGNPVTPRIMPSDAKYNTLINPYVPDLLNDLQLTDHYPIIQETKYGNVLSLNCMKKCKYEEKYQSYNNAFEKTETDEEYSKRLDLLAQLIITLINENSSMSFSLQEAPDYTTPQGRAFYDKIRAETGWNLVRDDVSCTKAGLVTLYNPRIIEPSYCQSSKPGIRAQKITFEFKDRRAEFNFTQTNMHGQLARSSVYARLISEIASDETINAIVVGDTNIPSSESAIDALNVSQQEKQEQRHVLRALNTSACGAYGVVQGTLTGSKNGVDTLDVLAVSASLRTDKTVLQYRTPQLDNDLIMTRRQANETSIRRIKHDLLSTVNQLGTSLTVASNYHEADISRRTTSIMSDSSLFKLRASASRLQADFLENNPGSMLQPLKSDPDILLASFPSKNDAQNFSDKISRELGISNKKPQPHRYIDGRFCLRLSLVDLQRINRKFLDSSPDPSPDSSCSIS